MIVQLNNPKVLTSDNTWKPENPHSNNIQSQVKKLYKSKETGKKKLITNLDEWAKNNIFQTIHVNGNAKDTRQVRDKVKWKTNNTDLHKKQASRVIYTNYRLQTTA